MQIRFCVIELPGYGDICLDKINNEQKIKKKIKAADFKAHMYNRFIPVDPF